MSDVVIRAREIKMVPVDQIQLNPDNSNIHTDEQIDKLCEIIKDQGFRDPIDISNLSGLTPAGEGRVLAARRLGMTEIPCIFQDFDDADQEWRHGIQHNSIATWARLDLSKINTQMGDMGPFDTSLLALPNFDATPRYEFPQEEIDPDDEDNLENDIDYSTEETDEPDVEEKEDLIPEVIEPRVKPGETYRIGSHTLYNGDCLKVLKTLPSNSVDSLVTDPPAGIAFMGKEWDEDKGGSKHWIKWLSDVMSEAKRVMKPGAHGLVWAIPRTSHWTATALEQAGFEIKDTILHCFGSGFPKSLSVIKSAEKQGIACVCEKNMSSLSEGMDAQDEVSSSSKSNLQSQMLGKSNKSVKQRNAQKTSSDLSHLSEDIQTQKQSSAFEGEDLQLQMQGRPSPKRSGLVGSSKKNIVQHEGTQESASIRFEQSGMEGRSDFQAHEGQLHRSEICEMPEGVAYDGTQGRVYNGTPSDHGNAHGPLIDSDRSNSSQGPQSKEQPHIESGMVPNQCGPQTCGRCGKAKFDPGLGTALKPAVEIWWLIRKPIEEDTVAANVLKHGTGGINIDKSRIGTGDDRTSGGVKKPIDKPEGEFSKRIWEYGSLAERPTGGRFPANLLLSHNEDCVEVGTKKVKGITGGTKPHKNEAPITQHGGFKENENRPYFNHASEDGTETVSAFECTEGCPVHELGEPARFFKTFEGYAISGPCGNENIKDVVTSVGKNAENKSDSLSTDGFGSKNTDQYLMGTISITKTKTLSTMTFPILNAFTKIFIGTVTIETEKIIDSSLEESVESVSLVSNTEALLHFQNGEQELIKGTVKIAQEQNLKNGKLLTENEQENLQEIGMQTISSNTIKNTDLKTKTLSMPIGENGIANGRAFYCAKPSKREKNLGTDQAISQAVGNRPNSGDLTGKFPDHDQRQRIGNFHPTVKSTKLMSYLINMITPPDGTILDCFGGSGTTMIAAHQNRFDSILIEKQTEYCDIILARAEHMIEKSAVKI